MLLNAKLHSLTCSEKLISSWDYKLHFVSSFLQHSILFGDQCFSILVAVPVLSFIFITFFFFYRMMYVGDFVLISSQNTAVTVQPTSTLLPFI